MSIQVLCPFFNRVIIICYVFKFIYLILAVLGLRFCARVFSSCGERGPLFIAVRGPLTVAASLVAEHRLQTLRLRSCGSWAQLLRGTWDPPRPGLEPVSPALAGRLSTTAPPGKPWSSLFDPTYTTPVPGPLHLCCPRLLLMSVFLFCFFQRRGEDFLFPFYLLSTGILHGSIPGALLCNVLLAPAGEFLSKQKGTSTIIPIHTIPK